MANNPFDFEAIVNANKKKNKIADSVNKILSFEDYRNANNAQQTGTYKLPDYMQLDKMQQPAANTAPSTEGKSQLRSRLYALANSGKYQGLNADVINDALDWNEKTGEVSFDGKNIGKGVLIDGYNHYDTPYIDSLFSDFVKDNKYLVSDDVLYNQGKQDWQNKKDQLWGIQVDDHETFRGDPFESEMGKNIMDIYLNQGNMAGLNRIASDAGGNGGNISSYAQANALNSLNAFKNSGSAAVINAWDSQKRGLLDSQAGMRETLGMASSDNQQTYNNWQDREDREQQRVLEKMVALGVVDPEMLAGYNPYINADGTVSPLTNVYGGYQTRIDEAQAVLDDPNATEDAKNKAEWDRYFAATARNSLIDQMGDEEKQQYSKSAVTPISTAAMNQFNKTNATNIHAIDTAATTETHKIDKEHDANIYGIDKALEGSQDDNVTQVTVAQIENDAKIKIAEFEKELAKISDPIELARRIDNSGFDEETKQAFRDYYLFPTTSNTTSTKSAIDKIKDAITAVPEDIPPGITKEVYYTYYPIQQLQEHYYAFVSQTSQKEVDNEILEQAKFVLSQEKKEINSENIKALLKRQKFPEEVINRVPRIVS